MLQDLVQLFVRLFIGVVALGLAIALFLIGIVALWYFLLIGLGLWLARRFYLLWKFRNTGPIQAEGVEIIIHEETRTKSPRPGRVIEHE